jgi:hypothetical protein
LAVLSTTTARRSALWYFRAQGTTGQRVEVAWIAICPILSSEMATQVLNKANAKQ